MRCIAQIPCCRRNRDTVCPRTCRTVKKSDPHCMLICWHTVANPSCDAYRMLSAEAGCILHLARRQHQRERAASRMRCDVDEGAVRWAFHAAGPIVAARPVLHTAALRVLRVGYAVDENPLCAFTEVQRQSAFGMLLRKRDAFCSRACSQRQRDRDGSIAHEAALRMLHAASEIELGRACRIDHQ
ncbi:hypothetical protein Tcan_08624 [Toxocara canis]|uniref:Uncharacterized protein n=2 Tax=Toxocara canis TaxID=6265 RepID=A0A0B2UUG9_TOXCA|nr:hypothetical protein Tcan_08624 [Toxocara canis]VDM38408.1 unnamed protein product [Toxocara canis]